LFLHIEFQKVKKCILAGHWWLTPVILATWEADIRRIMVQGHPKQIIHKNPISKITRAKWTGGAAQAIKHLFCKHEALSSNLNPTQEKEIHLNQVW
jgi:hypothetical protein